jgi:hypothetical protein
MLGEEHKRNDEYVWSSIFCSELNKIYGFDYTLHPEHNEDSPIDMNLASLSGKYPQLEVQLTHAVELPFIALESHDSADYSGRPTIEAIERKYEKLTRQGADLTRLILLVQGYMSHEAAIKAFADPAFEKYRSYPFKGIYYSAPAMMSGDTLESLQEGYIIAIKDAFRK